MVVGIIGAGASGMAAALAAAENPHVQVCLFERQARVGRKLQATGNGRCNLSNLNQSGVHYHGDDPGFSAYALQRFDPECTLEWFRTLGLITVAEPSGRVYPYSDQANSVVDVLRFALSRSNVQLYTGFEVTEIVRRGKGFAVRGADGSVQCDNLIVACGGAAGTKLGGTRSGYELLQRLGHHVTSLRPSLVQLKTAWAGNASLKGVRANCKVCIVHNGRVYAQSCGELQFTDYGVSGPVIFELSRDVCRGGGAWSCRLDFLPQFTPQQLKSELVRRCGTSLPTEELLTGAVHNRLGKVLIKHSGSPFGTQASSLTDAQIDRLCQAVKRLEIPIVQCMGMDAAQVTAGGIRTSEFDPKSMQSRLIPGLFACGELLDIDGDCGGYNLQWAWSSGRLAGTCAGRYRDDTTT